MKSNFKKVNNFLDRYDRFFLTAHDTPDGDALGSEVALGRMLEAMGKTVRIVNADPPAMKYGFLNRDHKIEVLNDDLVLPEDLKEWALLILDTNDTNNIGAIDKEILPYVAEYFIIDHHEGAEDILTANHVEQNASSTCELIWKIAEDRRWSIDMETAEALYTGILYDTGCFIYPKTTETTFRIAKDLVHRGVNPHRIYRLIYESNSVSSLKLQSAVLGTLELYYEDQVAVQIMTRETITQCGALYEEADTVINIPLKSGKIKVSIFLKENEAGILRCSLRSKDDIDVMAIAQEYGGGGHKNAAGFKSKYPLEEIRQKVLDRLSMYFT